jgi:fructose-1,6-bisphosphatase/sedoheptulose 1,7-bisphosphatase-like protein
MSGSRPEGVIMANTCRTCGREIDCGSECQDCEYKRVQEAEEKRIDNGGMNDYEIKEWERKNGFR